jgi:ribosomal protein S18 acetylase RimI-like enzyme
MPDIIFISEPQDMFEVNLLLLQYARSLNFDLCFQHFEEELKTLPGEYGPPDGCLLLAKYGQEPVGCVALRKIETRICEMKRLFVRPEYRGLKIGKRLVQTVIEKAVQLGYERMRLDTVPQMKPAQRLYETFGFTDIAPYRHNPIPGARFMELRVL